MDGKSWMTGARLGLYRGGTHEVERIPQCEVHANVINKAAAIVEAACTSAGVRGVSDDEEGELRYVQLSVERRSRKVALSLVWNTESAKVSVPRLPRLISTLWQDKHSETHDLWHSIWVNYRGPGGGNAIFSYDPKRWERLRGAEYVLERLFLDGTLYAVPGVDAGLELRFSPLVFRQANLDAFSHIVLAVADFVPSGSEVCELYAGVGAIGLALRPKLGGLRCSDGNPNAEACFISALRDQDRRYNRPLAHTSFLALDAADALLLDGPGADVLVVDPPRKGLDREVVAQLRAEGTSSIQRIIYVSCGFDAFERDLADLVRNDAWHLEHAQAHVLFPGVCRCYPPPCCPGPQDGALLQALTTLRLWLYLIVGHQQIVRGTVSTLAGADPSHRLQRRRRVGLQDRVRRDAKLTVRELGGLAVAAESTARAVTGSAAAGRRRATPVICRSIVNCSFKKEHVYIQQKLSRRGTRGQKAGAILKHWQDQ